jgi:hypothetical protein
MKRSPGEEIKIGRACAEINATGVVLVDGRELRHHASMLDPTSKRARAARRQARARARRRDGRRSVRFDVDYTSVVTALIDSRRLTEGEALKHANVEHAVSVVVAEWTRRWREAR